MILFKIDIKNEKDIVMARQKAREASKNSNFSITDQTRIITAVSELARNIYDYASAGIVLIEKIENANKEGLMISFLDNGPGIMDIDVAMQEGFTSGRGMGLGLPGSKKLMDEFEITSLVGKGTKVVIRKWL